MPRENGKPTFAEWAEGIAPASVRHKLQEFLRAAYTEKELDAIVGRFPHATPSSSAAEGDLEKSEDEPVE